MDYIFGYIKRKGVMVENLKTVGETHTDLKDFNQIIREYPDSTITDSFRVVEHYKTDTDAEGNCYDWYVIADHWRNISKKYEQAFTDLEESDTALSDAMIANYEEQAGINASVETALIELYEMGAI